MKLVSSLQKRVLPLDVRISFFFLSRFPLFFDDTTFSMFLSLFMNGYSWSKQNDFEIFSVFNRVHDLNLPLSLFSAFFPLTIASSFEGRTFFSPSVYLRIKSRVGPNFASIFFLFVLFLLTFFPP